MRAITGPRRKRRPALRPAAPTGRKVGQVRAPDVPPAQLADGAKVYREADRLVHAAVGAWTLGMSPASLLQAWQDWALHLAISPGKQQQIIAKALEKTARLSGFLSTCAAERGLGRPCISPLPQDRRFGHQGWRVFPFSLFQQSFLLWQQWWHNATTGVPGVSARHERLVEFYSRQWLDMVAPSNFALTNPEILERALRDGGANFVIGIQNLIEDLSRQWSGGPDPAAERFRPGHEVAATPGDVIFRNDLIELIRYRSTATTVHPEPVLLAPAWVMKYYILDLSPGNSLVRHLRDEGFQVYCISWRNPGRAQRDLSLEDYRQSGVMAALDAVGEDAGPGRFHGVGYCLGGTMLSIAAAAMARDGDTRLKTLSLLAAQVDFDEPGELGLFIDESQLSMLEDIMWSEGYLDQHRMAGAFQLLRSQDLVWSRIVRDYLMGERAEMTDLMAWNADATRMPYRMHSQYLRQFYLDNDLSQGRYRVAGRPVHLEDIKVPVFAVGTETDHVAPWRSVFKLMHLLDTDVDFVLTNGGHNAGIVAAPGHPRRAFRHLCYREGGPHPSPDDWLEGAGTLPGSWWLAWFEWLKARSGQPGVPRTIAGREPLAAAPGTYVFDA
ncbi:alpha/beta fold hydrolase [Nitratireductor mangrovi]|uniref:Alpha/beta fold hydrolase n=1 Tax=Nitratireductor mangrovi TaxID=2599600 RepID=A0A5B8L1G3_9HYPH|nr:alpha/beta fold hydrolase [Nitratireductor mangrovi]